MVPCGGVGPGGGCGVALAHEAGQEVQLSLAAHAEEGLGRGQSKTLVEMEEGQA